jgi:hypothetical protein
MPNTVVLLGDSILDNAAYTSPAPDTAARLRELAARDGAVSGEDCR